MQYIDFHTHTIPDDKQHVRAIVSCVAPEPLEKYENGNLFSYGIHPWYTNGQDLGKLLENVREMAHFNKVVAIGEAGLDKVKGPPMGEQKKIFCYHIEISEAMKKPLIIHSVKANNEVLRLRKKMSPLQPWILHGFSGHPQEMQQMVEAGFYLSFGPKILYHNNKASESLAKVPDNRFFLETDHTNKAISALYAKAADIRGISLKELESTINKNFKTLFD